MIRTVCMTDEFSWKINIKNILRNEPDIKNAYILHYFHLTREVFQLWRPRFCRKHYMPSLINQKVTWMCKLLNKGCGNYPSAIMFLSFVPHEVNLLISRKYFLCNLLQRMINFAPYIYLSVLLLFFCMERGRYINGFNNGVPVGIPEVFSTQMIKMAKMYLMQLVLMALNLNDFHEYL